MVNELHATGTTTGHMSRDLPMVQIERRGSHDGATIDVFSSMAWRRNGLQFRFVHTIQSYDQSRSGAAKRDEAQRYVTPAASLTNTR